MVSVGQTITLDEEDEEDVENDNVLLPAGINVQNLNGGGVVLALHHGIAVEPGIDEQDLVADFDAE